MCNSSIIRFTFSLALLVLSLLLFTQTVFAEEQLPPWWVNLKDNCLPNLQKYRGIEYCTGQVNSDNGTHTVHVIIVDIHEPDIRLEYIIAEGVDKQGTPGPCRDVNRTAKGTIGCDTPGYPQYYPVMTFDTAVALAQKMGAAVLINGDYSACTTSETSCKKGTYREHGPEGLTVVQGKRLDGPVMNDLDNNVKNRPWLAVQQTPYLRVEIHQWKTEPEGLPYPGIYTGMGGGPWMVEDGQISLAIANCNPEGTPPPDCCYGVSVESCRPNAAQTAVGISRDGRWLFLVAVDKGTPTVKDLARFMIDKLGCYKAIKLDGGGSTGLWYDGQEKITPNRELTNFLAVIAQPGNGIELPGGHPPSEPPLLKPALGWWEKLWRRIQDSWNSFWDSIFKRINDWKQEQKHNLERRIEEWWQETQHWIINEITRALQDWLNQCCGTVTLPAGTAIGVWILSQRKRRKRS